jgi:hypothetical protein
MGSNPVSVFLNSLMFPFSRTAISIDLDPISIPALIINTTHSS